MTDINYTNLTPYELFQLERYGNILKPYNYIMSMTHEEYQQREREAFEDRVENFYEIENENGRL